MPKKQREKGFTLIELMVVIIVIGILVAIALPNYIGATERARISSLKSNAHTLQITVEAYNVDHQVYPNSALEISQHESYKVFSNPFLREYRGAATPSGQGAWWTNDDGNSGNAPTALFNNGCENGTAKGLVLYVGLDFDGKATTQFTTQSGHNGNPNPSSSYLIYGCDGRANTIRRFVLSSGHLTSAAARLLQGS